MKYTKGPANLAVKFARTESRVIAKSGGASVKMAKWGLGRK